MRKALVAIAIIGGLAALAVLAAPRLAGGLVKRQIVEQAAERGLDVRVRDVDLTWSSVSVEGVCLHAPEPKSGVAVLCLDRARIDVPVLRAARGDIALERIVVSGGHLNLGPELGNPEEIQALFAAMAESVSARSSDEAPAPPSTPETAEPTEARALPDIEIQRFEVRVAGQPIPLDGVAAVEAVVSYGEDGAISARGQLEVTALRVVEVPFLSAAPDTLGFNVEYHAPSRWTASLGADTPLVLATPPALGGVGASLHSLRLEAPHTAEVGGVRIDVMGQELPLLKAESALLEVREFTTSLDDFYMARAVLVSPRIHVDLDADRVPTTLRAMGLVPPAASEGEDDGEGSAEEGEEAAPPSDDAPGLWAERIWWEKIPQRIDISEGALSFRRATEEGTETIAITEVSLEYALRAIRTQADVQLRAQLSRDGADAGALSADVTFNWASAALNLDLDLSSFDLGLLAAAHPELEALSPAGSMDLSMRFNELEDGSIPTFDGRLALRELMLAPPLLQEPVRLESASWDWRASMSRSGEPGLPARALVVNHGDGLLGEARFSFKPTIYRFDYENPRLGERFDIHFSVPDQSAQMLLGSIPTSLLGPVSEAQMSGTWGIDITFPLAWVAPTEPDEAWGIDIGESSEFEVRDSQLRLESLPEGIDVRRLNRATEFVFRTPTSPAGRTIRIPAPRQEAGGSSEAQGEESMGAAGPSGDWPRLQEISYFVTAATLYREDGRFFRNRGINWFQWRAVLEDAWQNRALGRGASTISMQLVKNVFLSHERSVERKLQELFLTYWMTRLVPKERILEVYLNVIEWGTEINGVVEASRYYFGVPASELSLAQSVWLSSIVPAPVRRGRQRAQGVAAAWSARQCADVMRGMASRGWITEAELAKGLATEIRFVTASEAEPLPQAPTFDPLAAVEDLRVAPDDSDTGERQPLNTDPQERIRALISSQIPLRP